MAIKPDSGGIPDRKPEIIQREMKMSDGGMQLERFFPIDCNNISKIRHSNKYIYSFMRHTQHQQGLNSTRRQKCDSGVKLYLS